jgi:FKBP-type peptidyl-prolyl cis-trans isomerase
MVSADFPRMAKQQAARDLERTFWSLRPRPHISDNGKAMTADFRYDRVFLIAGLFYGIEGMRVGGKRTLKISPHLAYRDKGIEGVIPPNAVLEIEVKIRRERTEFRESVFIQKIRFHPRNPWLTVSYVSSH